MGSEEMRGAVVIAFIAMRAACTSGLFSVISLAMFRSSGVNLEPMKWSDVSWGAIGLFLSTGEHGFFRR